MKADQHTWDDALAACLKAILEDGLSVEQALSRFPDIANDLRSELDAALWLHQQRQALSAYNWEIGLSRRRLENRLLLQRPDWHAYWRRLNILQRGLQIVVLLLLLITLAQFNNKVAYASETSIPGDPFYPLKLAREQAQLALTFGQAKEARVLLEIARQRSIELESLVLEGRYEDIGVVSNQVDRSFELAQEKIEDVSATQDSQALEQELRDTLELQQAVISALAGMVPPEARAQLIPLLNVGP
jgi:hypothetical protein